MNRTSLLLGLLLSASGCTRTPATSPQPARPAAAGDTENPELLRKRRLALMPANQGQPVDRLITNVQNILKQNPSRFDAWIALGRAWVRKAREASEPGYYTNADACADVAMSLSSEHALALDLRGLVLLNQHRFTEAKELAEQSIRSSSFAPMAYGTLSDAFLELGQYDRAEEAAQKMMELKPNLPAYARASYLAWLHGNAPAAKAAIRLAIDSASAARSDPEPRAWALTQAAHLFWHEGDYGGADAGYEMALKNFAEYPEALCGRGRVALAKGDAKTAAELLDNSFRRSPSMETVWLLGDARALLGDNKGAEAAYEILSKQGRRSDPRTLALFYATLGRNTAEAVQLAEEERKTRGDILTHDVYAFALHRAGRTRDAKREIDEALRLGTKDARLLYHAGAIYLAAGDKAGARRYLQEALSRNPKFDVHGAAEAQRLLASLK